MTEEERIYKYQVEESEYLPYCLENKLKTLGFFNAPASTKYHGAYEGGLFDHSFQVYLRLKDLTKSANLKWTRPESPFIVGMFHDICKCDQYILTDDGNGSVSFKYNEKTTLKGHGTKSVMILSTLIENGLTEEEMLCIRYHMGAYETDDWDGFDRAIRKYENVLWTHQADMLASKVDGV